MRKSTRPDNMAESYHSQRSGLGGGKLQTRRDGSKEVPLYLSGLAATSAAVGAGVVCTGRPNGLKGDTTTCGAGAGCCSACFMAARNAWPGGPSGHTRRGCWGKRGCVWEWETGDECVMRCQEQGGCQTKPL